MCCSPVDTLPRVFSLIIFLFSTLTFTPASAQALDLPAPSRVLDVTPLYTPALVKGLIIHPQEPLKFDFIIDPGQTGLKGEALRPESLKLIKYFLAALAIPEEDMWVNLSPYERDRIVPKAFGATAMGRDLLAQDYVLKQLSASLTYPERGMGQQFWNAVYAGVERTFGAAAKVPVNAFNKVWIVPDTAKVYEHGNGAFVVDGHLKLMIEEDYLAITKNRRQPGDMFQQRIQRTCPQAGCQTNNALNVKATEGTTGPRNEKSPASHIIRAMILPALEKEVNEGRHFAQLRQIYNAMILATWYKRRLRESIIGKQYVDQRKITGIAIADAQAGQRIYAQYLHAFKQGVYNYVKEDKNTDGDVVPRKYMSGGFSALRLKDRAQIVSRLDPPSAAKLQAAGDAAVMVTWEAQPQGRGEKRADAAQIIVPDPFKQDISPFVVQMLEAKEGTVGVFRGIRFYRSGRGRLIVVVMDKSGRRYERIADYVAGFTKISEAPRHRFILDLRPALKDYQQGKLFHFPLRALWEILEDDMETQVTVQVASPGTVTIVGHMSYSQLLEEYNRVRPSGDQAMLSGFLQRVALAIALSVNPAAQGFSRESWIWGGDTAFVYKDRQGNRVYVYKGSNAGQANGAFTRFDGDPTEFFTVEDFNLSLEVGKQAVVKVGDQVYDGTVRGIKRKESSLGFLLEVSSGQGKKPRSDLYFLYYSFRLQKADLGPYTIPTAAQAPGGIDLNAKNLSLDTSGRSSAMIVRAPDIKNIEIDGLYPVIRQVTRAANWRVLLGLEK